MQDSCFKIHVFLISHHSRLRLERVFDSQWTVISSHDFIAEHAEHYWTCYPARLVLSTIHSCFFGLFKNRCGALCRARRDELCMDPLIDKMTGSCQTWSIEFGSIDVSFADKDFDDTQKEQCYPNTMWRNRKTCWVRRKKMEDYDCWMTKVLIE